MRRIDNYQRSFLLLQTRVKRSQQNSLKWHVKLLLFKQTKIFEKFFYIWFKSINLAQYYILWNSAQKWTWQSDQRQGHRFIKFFQKKNPLSWILWLLNRPEFYQIWDYINGLPLHNTKCNQKHLHEFESVVTLHKRMKIGPEFAIHFILDAGRNDKN